MPLLIYLVEDNPTIRDATIQTLREEFEASIEGVTDNETDAVTWLTSPGQAWDLSIVDMFLKQGCGLGVLRALPSIARYASVWLCLRITRPPRCGSGA